MSGAAPSIARRLARALTLWTAVWAVAVGAALWLAAAHEVDELLDEALSAAGPLVATGLRALPPGAAPTAPPGEHFAWQVIESDGSLSARSPLAPQAPWHVQARPGFSDVPAFRVYGLATGGDGRMLYVAQARQERHEARLEVWLSAVLAALAIGGLGQAWLRARVHDELAPLRRLSARLQDWRIDDAVPPRLGAAERDELAPVHEAIDRLADRLARRLAQERAVAAHAAHALRTPLAGIDAQLAVAQREVAPAVRERLDRVRAGTRRLQAVVDALLVLFRSGGEPRRTPVTLGELADGLSTPELVVEVAAGAPLDADADLLAAALMNLVDNARRHGARHVRIDQPGDACVRVRDDGPGLTADRRAALQRALDGERYDEGLGLGLTLADRVARAHGGRLRLLDAPSGFAAELVLGP